MNISQLENKLSEFDIFPTAREICNVIGMNEQSYSRKKKAETDIKLVDVRKIETFYNVTLTGIQIQTYSDSVQLKYYPDVYATCGNGGFADTGANTILNVPVEVIKDFDKNNVYSVINARSNSMSPVVAPSDLLIIKHTDVIEDNKIHIFTMDDRIFCKYLSINLDEVLIKSANPEYKNMSVKYDDINVNGVVVGLMRNL